MAQDYTKDQQNAVSRTQTLCATILDAVAAAKQLRQEAIDKGYAPGTPTTGITDAIVQTVLTATSYTTSGTTRVGYTALEKLRP